MEFDQTSTRPSKKLLCFLSKKGVVGVAGSVLQNHASGDHPEFKAGLEKSKVTRKPSPLEGMFPV